MGSLLQSKANQAAAEALGALVAEERPLALVGAGMSVPHMPSWKKLLDELEAHVDSIPDEIRSALRDEEDLLWRAEEYRRLIRDDEKYQSVLRRRFGADVTLAREHPAVALVRLPFRHFMTTNYDDVLLRAHEAAGQEPPQRLDWSRERDVRAFIFGLRSNLPTRYLLHLHGHHSAARTMVLTDRDYTERYVRSFDTTRKLFAIFTTERVVFAGFSLSDPDLMALLREVNAVMRSEKPRHFAIMALERPETEILVRSRLRKRYGIDPVFYDNSDQSHRGLIDVLRYLSERAPQEAALASAAPQGFESLEEREHADPDDPQKGLWGGTPKAQRREVTAGVRELEPDWFETTITVRSTDAAKPLEGEVVFHLHPTLVPPVRRVLASGGVATLVVESYGAYTVGVEADGGTTKLELDLSQLPGAPMMFRMN